jgi:peroxiredoxin (alkyl hydroperoxide reductase subunit C)
MKHFSIKSLFFNMLIVSSIQAQTTVENCTQPLNICNMETKLETNTQISLPRIGDKAPDFVATTTQGVVNFPVDYSGKWVIFFSHPADFTPVCTSEFMTFANMQDDFTKLNTQLIGLSIDGLYSHIAWLRTIKEKIEFNGMKNIEVKFPLIEDITMEIAGKYGMIQPGESSTKAVRAVFFIDPFGIVRAMIYYPLSLGRNFEELKRVIIALQTADNFAVATPANWEPGDDVMIPTAGSCGIAKERMETSTVGVTCYDWFFCTKKLSLEELKYPPVKN